MGMAESAFRVAVAGHVFWYRTLKGRFAGKSLLLLTTTGRRTGRERVSPVLRIDDGPDYLIAAPGINGGWSVWLNTVGSTPKGRCCSP